jgi:hypothetical protein
MEAQQRMEEIDVMSEEDDDDEEEEESLSAEEIFDILKEKKNKRLH